jgi:hypothetical protein
MSADVWKEHIAYFFRVEKAESVKACESLASSFDLHDPGD